MINKDIREFKADLDKYNASLNSALNKEECEKIYHAFKDVVKTYVYSANDFCERLLMIYLHLMLKVRVIPECLSQALRCIIEVS